MLTGENGILTQANNAKEETEIAKEKEAIILENTYMIEEENYIGKKLYDKNFENGSKWDIWIETKGENQKIYGSGWYYIEKGTDVNNYGKTKYEWLVQYQNGEIIKIDSENFQNLSYGKNLAVKEGLIFNADPINMETSTSWGENVILNGFTENSGWTESAFIFDGQDDWIQVNGNLDIEDEITMEFYGKVTENTGSDTYNYVPFFAAYNGRILSTSGLCLRMFSLGEKNIMSNFGYADCGNSNIWENSDAKHNLRVSVPNNVKEENMFTITFRHSDNTYSVYDNGTLIKREVLNNEYWENFKLNELPTIEYFQIGKGTWNNITNYFCGEVYSIRIYNKCLQEEEVKSNYQATKAYHDLIKDE